MRISVFCLPTQRIETMRTVKVRNVDWLLDSTNLFDFNCERLVARDVRQEMLLAVANAVAGGDNRDPGTLAQLLDLLYTDPAVSLFCRLVLVKMRAAEELVVAIWTGAMEKIVNEGRIHPELVEAFWRDFALIPEHRRRDLEPLVWEKVARPGGLGMFLSAFI
jgi:hypothetical protein